jgi:hypothetical protein
MAASAATFFASGGCVVSQLPALDADAVDRALYDAACAVEGYFATAEADLLIRAIQSAGTEPTYLEIGSFRGRSTMFALSALPRQGRIVGVDAFIYNHHSPSELRATLNDPRVSIFEGTLLGNWSELSNIRPGVILVDADHSFVGTSLDLSLAVALAHRGALIATHDVSDRFPGVQMAVGAFSESGVLSRIESAGDLVLWRVESRPGWLVDPRPEIDWPLPDPLGDMVPSIVEVVGPASRVGAG